MFNNFNNDALMAAAAQMLQASGPSRTPTGLGQIIGGGMSTYMGATQAAKQRELEERQAAQMAEMRAMQIQEMEGTLSDRAMKRSAAQKMMDYQTEFAKRGAATQPGAIPNAPPSAMTEPQAMQQAPQPSAKPSTPYQSAMEYAQFLQSKGEIEQAMQIAEEAQNLRPKIKSLEKVRANGKVLFAPVFDDGTMGEPLEREVAEKLEFRDGGGFVAGIDSYTGEVKKRLVKSQTPDSIASNAIQIRGQNITRQGQIETNSRARAEIGAGGKPPAGYRWAADGASLEAIPGGPAGKSAVATEGERKAATLLMRLQGSEQQLRAALKDNPDAAKPGLMAQGLRNIGAEAIANTATNTGRQQVESAQLDILDAALTLGTGAAYTREQLEGYRKSYFPQIGDKAKNIADKEARLKNVIEAAKIAAGRAGSAVPAQADQPAPKTAIPQGAANMLKMKPSLRAAFDAKYGAGAAASILGK